jgi:hypothetical protein
MGMTKNQLDEALKCIKRWSPIQCAVCRTSNWGVLPKLYEVREFLEGDIGLTSALVPVIAVGCQRCGHLIFFNAVQLGLVASPKPPGPPEPPEPDPNHEWPPKEWLQPRQSELPGFPPKEWTEGQAQFEFPPKDPKERKP